MIKDAIPDYTFNNLANHGGTTCDQLMDPMSFHLSYGSPSVPFFPGLRTILALFLEAGGHTSKPFIVDSRPGDLCINFDDEITHLSLFEDQIDSKSASPFKVNSSSYFILVMDLGDLVPIILQRQEDHLSRIIKNANSSILNHKSPVNGLAPIHFAVLWPAGLRMLVESGVNIDIEDDYGRRPVHLAVAQGIAESVQCLLNADCGLFTPAKDYSLLQYALVCHNNEESRLVFQVSQALHDRHDRLRDMAISYLPPSVSTKLELTLGELQEQRAPSIIETLLSYGIDVPPALELDGKGFYNYHPQGQITPEVANALCSAGFQRFDKPNDNGWTPFLQSWFYHRFEMIDWFARKGVKLDSRHTDIPLTALHLYAKGMRYSRTASKDTSAMKEYYIQLLQEKLGIPCDDCSCACSPDGCTPVKFVLQREDDRYDSSQKDQVREFMEDLDPPKPLLNQYIYQITRHILFDLLGGEHTCCSLEESHWSLRGLPRPTRKTKWRKMFYDFSDFPAEHLQCCTNGLPVPRVESLRALQDSDVFSVTLDYAMSHYDEMERPDTMPAEEQVFEYINWILAEGYLDIDASNGCEHDDEVTKRCPIRW